MARRLYTVDNLLSEVRQLLDEDNNDALRDEEILSSLNRGQDHVVDVLSAHYPDPYMASTELAVAASQDEFPIPEDSYSDKVTKVEFKASATDSYYQEVQRINYRDVTIYENSNSSVFVPYYYYIVGDKLRFVPKASGQARVWYVRMPDQLVVSQGRITGINTSTQKITVDSLGSDVSTDISSLSSYFNVCDGQTGVVKATFQAKNVNNNTLEIKTQPTALNLPGRTLYNDLTGPTNSDGSQAVALNDYISVVDGTCVPYFSRPASNFLIQYAVAELKRKLTGGAADMEERLKQDFLSHVTKTYTGREQKLRVKKVSNTWNNNKRLYRPFSRG